MLTNNRSRPCRVLGRLLGYERELEDLRGRVRELEWDATFGMWTRNAFLRLCRTMPRGLRTVAFLDLNDIHGLNHSLGYTEVDRRVKAAFSIPFRSSDLVARWYSGDEIVILFDSDETGARNKIQELQRSAGEHGLAFMWELGAWDVGRQSISEVINALADTNCRRQKQKKDVDHDDR